MLDDDGDAGPVKAHLVQTSWALGLTEEKADEVIKMLTAE